MIKRIVVAGCRDYENYEQAKAFIENCIKEIRKENTLVFMSGKCRGADALGEKYAKENGFDIEYYPAQWEKLGRAAGPIRNQKMAEVCDFVICFWDGESRGTRSMIGYAKKLNKPIKVKRIKKHL